MDEDDLDGLEDSAFQEAEQKAFIKDLDQTDSFGWMNEKRYSNMFSKIEKGLQGVLGKGQFEWVDRRVFDQVFDRLTLMSLYKLMTQGHLDTLDFPIARGKEAHVFHGTSDNGPVAVKIFHTSNAVFKNLMKYIEGDQRFGGLSRRHRKLVDIWVRKEYRNLLRLEKWGLRVPHPIAVHKNVLVMEYIGDEVSPAPRLRDAQVENPEEVFDYLIHFTATAWQKANLVHADLSDYNILWHEGKAVVIDVGQGVVQSHPKSEEFLVRDVKQLVRWANHNGIEIELADALYDVLEMNLDEEE